jgi:hypothetical protein
MNQRLLPRQDQGRRRLAHSLRVVLSCSYHTAARSSGHDQ